MKKLSFRINGTRVGDPARPSDSDIVRASRPKIQLGIHGSKLLRKAPVTEGIETAPDIIENDA